MCGPEAKKKKMGKAKVMENEQATEISSSSEETTDNTNNNTLENSTNIYTEDLRENLADKGDNQSPDHQLNNNEEKPNAGKDTTDCEIIPSLSPNSVEAGTSMMIAVHNSTTELPDKEHLTLVNKATVSDSLLELDLLEESANKEKTLTSMLEKEYQNIS
ncbi:6856_t:CDS:2, partial [Dentiscutata heterogama]